MASSSAENGAAAAAGASVPSERSISYVEQLRQLFNSCDVHGSGFLGKDELFDLCDKLQLDEEQSYFILDRVVNEDDPIARVSFFHMGFIRFYLLFIFILFLRHFQVDFDEFKDAFLSLLTSRETSTSRCGGQDDVGQEIKHSGSPFAAAAGTINLAKTCSPSSSTTLMDFTPSDSDIPPVQPSQSFAVSAATAESTLTIPSQAPSTSTNATAEYIREIWNKLRVGEDGFLNREELYKVCEDIGMTPLDDDLIQQLFEKLDSDKDGKVSFDEFLEGLFKQEQGSSLDIASSGSKHELSKYDSQKAMDFQEGEDDVTKEVVESSPTHCFSPQSCSSSPIREKNMKSTQQDQLPKMKDQTSDDFTSSPCYLLSLDKQHIG